MQGIDELPRRDFLLRAAVLTAGTAALSVTAASRAEAAAPSTTTAWLLNTNWGYPLGAHGRTSCHCRACPPHAANKLFADQAAATANRAHQGCLCQPIAMAVSPATYGALFAGGVTSVDRRDPAVAALLAPAPPTSDPSAPTSRIIDFTPRKGRVGDRVVITGVGLAALSAIRFGDIAAPETEAVSDTEISTRVPQGATAGVISVVLPGTTLTSATRFTVLHRRRISFALREGRATGVVRVVDGLPASTATVLVQRQLPRGSGWHTVAKTPTAVDGSYVARGLGQTGTYRAVAARTTLPSGDVYLKAISKSRSQD